MPNVLRDEGRALRQVRSGLVFAALTAASLITTHYWLFGDVDLNLADEGFLWQGVQRTAAGEVPIRDFRSYDPGRFYWGAAWSLVLGDGILALRLSVYVLLGIGLFCALLAAQRIVPSRWLTVPVGLVLMAWVFRYYGTNEYCFALVGLYLAVRLVESRSAREYFLSGLFVGLSAFFGRNYALYGGVGFTLVLAYLAYTSREGRNTRHLAMWAGGVVVGALPMLFMLTLVPGFADELVRQTLAIRKFGTNLPFRAPLPWRIDYRRLDWLGGTTHFFMGVSYLLVPLVYLVGIVTALRSKVGDLRRRSVLIACTMVGIPWAHYFSVRADPDHLSSSMLITSLAIFSIPAAYGYVHRLRPTLATWSLIVVVTLFATWGFNPTFEVLRPGYGSRSLVSYRVRGDVLRLPAWTASYLAAIERVTARHVKPEEKLFIAPARTTLYPVLGKIAPVHDTYMIFPARPEVQRAVIRSLDEKGVNWALIIDTPAADGRNDLRLRNTYPLVWQYLGAKFEVVRDPELPRAHFLLKRRSATG
jgi:hypothetical protein